jgi:hypothetical protein
MVVNGEARQASVGLVYVVVKVVSGVQPEGNA